MIRHALLLCVVVLTALAVDAHGKPRARADTPACDGHPASPEEHVACRARLVDAWHAATAAEKKAEGEHTEAEANEASAKSQLDEATRELQRVTQAGEKAAVLAAEKLLRAATERHVQAVQTVETSLRRFQTAHDAVLAIEASLKREAFRAAYDANHCERGLTVCMGRDGELIADVEPAEALPASIRVGDKLLVLVLTVEADRTVVTVAFEGRKSLDTTFDKSTSQTVQEIRGASTEPPSIELVALPFPFGPVAAEFEDVTISFQRTALKDGIGAETQYVVAVDHGHSYYSVAFLLAATFKGDRHVLRDLDTTADHAVAPGLALNIFPFGRQQGVIGYLRKCQRVRRCLANTVGFQIGTDLDLTNPTDKLYVGLVFEPVAGLALVGGVSLRKVAVVPPAGALPTLEAMDGTSPTDSRYVTRGYIGVTITLDLLETISSTGSKIRSVKLP